MKSETDEKPAVLLGGPPFDHDTYFQGMEQAKTLYIQAIHTYWEKYVKSDPTTRRLMPAALALFAAENPGSNPYEIVTRGEPPCLPSRKGHAVFTNEPVPAWTLYLTLADYFVAVVAKVATP